MVGEQPMKNSSFERLPEIHHLAFQHWSPPPQCGASQSHGPSPALQDQKDRGQRQHVLGLLNETDQALVLAQATSQSALAGASWSQSPAQSRLETCEASDQETVGIRSPKPGSTKPGALPQIGYAVGEAHQEKHPTNRKQLSQTAGEHPSGWASARRSTSQWAAGSPKLSPKPHDQTLAPCMVKNMLNSPKEWRTETGRRTAETSRITHRWQWCYWIKDCNNLILVCCRWTTRSCFQSNRREPLDPLAPAWVHQGKLWWSCHGRPTLSWHLRPRKLKPTRTMSSFTALTWHGQKNITPSNRITKANRSNCSALAVGPGRVSES